MNRVFVDLEGIQAVFELVAPLDGLGGQLARLADRHEAGVQSIRQRRTEDKAARLNSQHGINLRVEVVFGKRVDQRGEADLVLKQGGDVVKKNSLLGEVGDFANQSLQMVAVFHDGIFHD